MNKEMKIAILRMHGVSLKGRIPTQRMRRMILDGGIPNQNKKCAHRGTGTGMLEAARDSTAPHK